jgi:hypothetical protein
MLPRTVLKSCSALCLVVFILSCQDSSTGPTASALVTGRWGVEHFRVPDSATWEVHSDSGTFTLTHPSTDTFQVQSALPQPLGSDTLDLSLFTQGLRTTFAHCQADIQGMLSVLGTSQKDSRALHVLQILDSIRAKDSITYGATSASKAAHIAGLQKLYAQLLLSEDTVLKGFPAQHPVGLDTLAVIDQVLLLGAQAGKTLAGIDSLVALDSAVVRTEIRKLAQAGKLDSAVLLPFPLSVAGLPSSIPLVEDSLSRVAVSFTGATSDSIQLRMVSADTTKIGSFQAWLKRSDTLRLQAKPDANGGPVQLEFLFRNGAKTDTATAVAQIAGRNDAPTFQNPGNLSRTFDSLPVTLPNFVSGIVAGPSDELSQTVRFEVACDTGANLYTQLPTVDGSGVLQFTARSAGHGVFRLRAHDNGDSTGSNVNTSGWKSFSIDLLARPVLQVSSLGDTLKLVEDSTTTFTATVQNLHGSQVTVRFTPADTTLISTSSWKLSPDANGKISFPLQARKDANGGPLFCSVKFSDSLDAVTQAPSLKIAARNDAPAFRVVRASWMVVANSQQQTLVGFLDSISAGPSNEAQQKASFEVTVPSDQAALFSTLPSVDSSGTLHFAGKNNQTGTAHLQIRAHDNGDSTGTNGNTSDWKEAVLVFDVAPTLSLSTRTLTQWEGEKSQATASVWSSPTGGTPKIDWTSSDTTLLPHDSVVFPLSGADRAFQLRPVVKKWGTDTLRFTITDSLGLIGHDSLILTVNPVNHAPQLTLESTEFTDTTWTGFLVSPGAGAAFDDATRNQGGVAEIQWENPSDSLLVSFQSNGGRGGMLAGFSAKVDTTLDVAFRLRLRDNGGTDHGGVDTSAWSSRVVLHLVDSLKDAQGNGYRARRMPDGKVWMRSNLRMAPPDGAYSYCAPSDCPDGVNYMSSTVFWSSGATSTSVNQQGFQGICPVGWRMMSRFDLSNLFKSVPIPDPTDSAFSLRSVGGWMVGCGHGSMCPLASSDSYGGFFKSSGSDLKLWVAADSNNSAGMISMLKGYSDVDSSIYIDAEVRCLHAQ